jgi:hypothetical protein
MKFRYRFKHKGIRFTYPKRPINALTLQNNTRLKAAIMLHIVDNIGFISNLAVFYVRKCEILFLPEQTALGYVSCLFHEG